LENTNPDLFDEQKVQKTMAFTKKILGVPTFVPLKPSLGHFEGTMPKVLKP
jgi:hypothetical protein